MTSKEIGNAGEEAAVSFLEQHGYAIIDTNVRPFPGLRRGEIDIVAWQGDILCIIEVKTRRYRSFDATQAITHAKRRQLTRLAHAYIDKYRIISTEVRFDIVCIYNQSHRPGQEVELIAGAFDPVY